jgi:integrase
VSVTHNTVTFDGQETAKASFDRNSNKSRIVINPPKTVDSNRIVPIAKLPYKWLKKYSAVIGDADAYVLTLTKKILEPRAFRETYKRYLTRLGIQYLNPHCMRHTFATQMLHSKVDVATIAAILGHSSPAITLEIYSHTNEDEKKKQVNAVFGKLFK